MDRKKDRVSVTTYKKGKWGIVEFVRINIVKHVIKYLVDKCIVYLVESDRPSTERSLIVSDTGYFPRVIYEYFTDLLSRRWSVQAFVNNLSFNRLRNSLGRNNEETEEICMVPWTMCPSTNSVPITGWRTGWLSGCMTHLITRESCHNVPKKRVYVPVMGLKIRLIALTVQSSLPLQIGTCYVEVTL